MLLKSFKIYYPAGAMIENVKRNKVCSKETQPTTLCILTYRHLCGRSLPQ